MKFDSEQYKCNFIIQKIVFYFETLKKCMHEKFTKFKKQKFKKLFFFNR